MVFQIWGNMKLTARLVEGLIKEVVTAERFDGTMKSRPRCPDATGRVRKLGVPVQLGKKHRRMTLGALTAVGLIKPRERGPTFTPRVKLGQDPAAEKAEAKERRRDVRRGSPTGF